MAFDWAHYLAHAKRLIEPDVVGEADSRSAVSRAYYALYHAALRYARNELAFIEPRSSPHEALWKHLDRPQREEKQLYRSGTGLKEDRIKADYKGLERIDKLRAMDAIAKAERGLKAIASLTGTHEVRD